MVEFTEEMKNAIEDMYDDEFDRLLPKRMCYLATAGKNGIPNVVPMSMVKVIDRDKILIADCTLLKTYNNMKENPKASLTTVVYRRWKPVRNGEMKVEPGDLLKWEKGGGNGWQFKGDIEILTEGKWFNLISKEVKKRFGEIIPIKSAIILTVTEIYSVLDGRKIQ